MRPSRPPTQHVRQSKSLSGSSEPALRTQDYVFGDTFKEKASLLRRPLECAAHLDLSCFRDAWIALLCEHEYVASLQV